ncbi:microtubule-associated serine/threonine-protein kinase 3-like [Seriola aureovittata]|uniref:microtubule-associated serine/threonine-protein kinase 3-like n=1 Tax=Seriola aureovittata TaxID=2871759 RepID=UPI0024BD66EA|nr:microtubule-associated serine/threonine-protein kinase 3-like [Seriola aureovittata]
MEDFETVQYINSGAFGTVNLVRHRETGQALALKQIKRQSLISETDVEQLLVEHDILTFTDNPFVVAMYCSFETEKDLCMVMEYVEGGDCDTLLQRFGRFPVDMAQMYIAEIVCGVEYIHSFGIVHRDLKPSNLLITLRGHIKITDFGLSKIGSLNMAAEVCAENIANEFTDGEIAGTPIYLAPELYQGEVYGKPVDWWAVGVILYQFLVGSFPFDGENDDELRNEVINKNVTWPEERDVVPYEAQVIIILLLRKNSIQRLGTGGASEVKEQPFFQDVDFDNLRRREEKMVQVEKKKKGDQEGEEKTVEEKTTTRTEEDNV